MIDLDLHQHLTTLREFDRVAYQIDEHLTQPSRIADGDARYVRQDVTDDFEAFLIGAQRKRLQQVGEMIAH